MKCGFDTIFLQNLFFCSFIRKQFNFAWANFVHMHTFYNWVPVYTVNCRRNNSPHGDAITLTVGVLCGV